MKTVNIYYIFDASVKIRGNAQHRIEENITRISRALGFSPYKTKLHLIGYRDRAFFGKPHEKIGAYGNPDFAEGLRMLGNVLDYGRKYEHSKARSVFIWHTSGEVLEGWKSELERLYKNKEFAFGLRYVVQHGTPDKYAKEALYRFTETPERILHHFSEGRLCSLVENIASTKY